MTNAQIQPAVRTQTDQTPDSAFRTPQLEILPRKLTRNGKIARLPYLERDMVNRMLRDNIPHPEIVEALQEHGIRVKARNISNWKTRGGYREWCEAQDVALQTRLLQDNLTDSLRKSDAGQIPEVGLQLAATHLSRHFFKPETQDQLATNPDKSARAISALCRLARHIHVFQKYRDDSSKELGYKYNPGRIRRQDEKDVESTREIYCAADLGERPGDPIKPGRNFIPKELSPQLREYTD